MKIKTFIFFIIAGYLLSTSAWAEHEANHRYNIRGYVLDGRQQGIGGLDVRVYSGTQLLESITTAADGYYSLHLHLHDTDFGQTLLLRAGQYEAELRVRFDASDQSTARVHEANFVDGRFTETPIIRFRMPGWVYPVGGLLLVVVAAVVLESRRKKKIKQKINVAHSDQQPHKHRSKRRRRKKH